MYWSLARLCAPGIENRLHRHSDVALRPACRSVLVYVNAWHKGMQCVVLRYHLLSSSGHEGSVSTGELEVDPLIERDMLPCGLDRQGAMKLFRHPEAQIAAKRAFAQRWGHRLA